VPNTGGVEEEPVGRVKIWKETSDIQKGEGYEGGRRVSKKGKKDASAPGSADEQENRRGKKSQGPMKVLWRETEHGKIH